MPAKYLNILALSAIVFLACSFSPTPVTALSVDSHGLHARHAHIGHALAKRAPRRCKPRAAGDPTTPASTPAVTPANPSNPPATSPTPAAAPAPAPAASSGKKAGLSFAIWDSSSIGPALDHFKLPKVSAIYNWGPLKVEGAEARGYFDVPMLSGRRDFDVWRTVVLGTPGYANHVLGFNEPDHGGQADLTVGDAVYWWGQLMLPLRNINPGITLISPAVTSGPSGEAWFDGFNAACSGCFDKIAIHWYGTDAQEFIKYVQHWHDKYGKPIWVTEVACMDFVTYAACPNVQAFAGTITAFMDSADYVEFYFPFVIGEMRDVNPVNQLVANLYPTDLAHIYFG